MALNAKQQRFAREYLVDLNATQAAIRAGYSAKTAGSQGERLLKNVEIAGFIEEANQRRADRVEVKSADILLELLRLARVDIGEAFTPEGNLKPLHEMAVDTRRAISAVEVTTLGGGEVGVLTKVKFWDKTRALELLGKHLRLFVDRVEHSGKVSLEQLVAAAAKEEP